MANEGGALAGIRVLDLTDYQAGPACTQLLGMLGADVIKIEMPGFGGYTRMFQGEQKDVTSIWFLVLNANKRGVTINLQTRGGKEVLTALIKKSDVLVENFAPGTIERLGFGWEHVHKLNPRLVYTSIKGFGSSGPYSHYKVFEGIAQATGGTMFMNGTEATPPLNNGAAIGDSGSGVLTVAGILAALFQRERTGVGQFVDISQQEACLNLIRTHIRAHQELGKPPTRGGRGRVRGIGEGIFACAPGGPNDYVVINIAGHLHMRVALLDAIGRPDMSALVARSQEISEEEVLKHSSTINDAIGEWMKQHTKHEAMHQLSAAGVPVGAIYDTADLIADEHLISRDMIVKLKDPKRGEFITVGNPLKLSDSKVPITRPPMIGEHTVEVLKEVAGLSENRIAELQKEGAV